MENNQLQLVVNDKLNQFELIVDGYTAFIKFKLIGSKMFLIHTEVPEELKGKGIAGAMVEKALRFAREKGYAIVPICPYVQAYLKKHPEWRDIISKDADRFIHKEKKTHD
jgi:predicted GNAT family acetyltransferase